MVEFGTPEWLEAYRTSINESPTYRQAAATWEGEVAFAFEAEPARGWPETKYSVMDLWHGECRWAGEVDAARAQQSPFLVRGPYTRWKQLAQGELDPIKAMMQGKLRLRGSLPAIVRHVKAAHELVALASQIPTEFPDETSH